MHPAVVPLAIFFIFIFFAFVLLLVVNVIATKYLRGDFFYVSERSGHHEELSDESLTDNDMVEADVFSHGYSSFRSYRNC